MSTQQHLSQTHCQPKDPSLGHWALPHWHGDVGELLLAGEPLKSSIQGQFYPGIKIFPFHVSSLKRILTFMCLLWGLHEDTRFTGNAP